MGNLEIRSAKLEDIERLLEIYSYYVENTAVTFEYEVPNIDEFTSRFKEITKIYPFLVVCSGNKILGYAYARKFYGRRAYEHSCELTIYLDKKYKRMGIGTKIYHRLVMDLKSMGITNCYACVAVTNENDKYLNHDSAYFHKEKGFKAIGRFHKCGYKFGRWYDVIWYELIIGKHLENQPGIIKFTDLS